MIATWVLGARSSPGTAGWFASGWLHAKLAARPRAVGPARASCRDGVKDFAADRNTRPARFYRLVNEVPTVLMIAIVILVVVKPF